jgi:glucose/arabinose dehydrogenase
MIWSSSSILSIDRRPALGRGLALVAILLLFSSLSWPQLPVANADQISGGTVRTKVQVPASMRSGAFSQDRYLNLPPNFSISVYARLGGARFMATAPNGDLLVSQPDAGKVVLLRPVTGGDPQVFNFATGLRRPHDIVFHTIGATTYVYISETNQINRFVYNSGDTSAHDRQVVITGLPDSSTPELGGAYGHELKNIALDSNHKLYVSIASTCNACLSDTQSNPKRGAIYQYDADGKNGRLFAQGLRNAEGLAFIPGTNDLWAAVNNRDNIAVPDPKSPNYQKVITSYVDNHPPEEFTKVRDGGNYGWPFCNPTPDSPSGYDNMPFERDVQFNADGHVDCNKMDRINKGIQAHSAPLGLTFLQNTAFAQPYRAGAITILHGSWNRALKTGYKLAYFPWNSATQLPGAQVDLVTGWLDDSTQAVWGRPVDVAVDLQGNLMISDDYSGTVYKMTYNPPGGRGATGFADPAFNRVWNRTDQVVWDGRTSRTYMWGPGAFTAGMKESYKGASASGSQDQRLVQYYDKSRMEINNPNGDQSNPFYVTNGLLARELISGQLQLGDTLFEKRAPADIGVAGDIDDTSGPTYAAFGNLLAPATANQGALVTNALNRSGQVRDGRADFGKYNVTLTGFVPETGHSLASVFAQFLQQTGPVLDNNGQLLQGRLFDPQFYATGLPISQPYWAKVKVAGQIKDVLMQAFERRVLTYTPSNPAGFQVEMGNVGRHYYLWRYGK